MMAAAMGLRTELRVQANRAAPGSSSPLGPRIRSTLQMQHAKQREQPPRGIEIDVDLALEARLEQRRAFVVKPSPAHIERFDLRGRRVADRLEIAFADDEVILNYAPQGRERQHDAAGRFVVLKTDVEHEPIF